jgi:alkylhydroperoxidase family enzyme
LNAHHPMSLPEDADLSPLARSSLDEVAAARGGITPNVFRAMALADELVGPVGRLGAAIRNCSLLDPLERELLILTVARELGCTYEWTHHRRVARTLAPNEQVLALLADPDTPRLAAMFDIAREIARGRTPDVNGIGRLREAAGERVTVATLLTVGYYVMLARFIEAVGVPLEDGFEPIAIQQVDDS